MRKPNPETHQACRSLLQKAVRRGNVSLTEQVAYHLQEVGDTGWLRMRAAVITFEECWPLGTELDLTRDFSNTVSALTRAARAVKAKDAAGLGTLAYALSMDDQSVLTGSSADRDIRIVAEAIKRPRDFWEWTAANCSQDRQRALVESTLKAYRRGGWPWDRAFMQAAAYLAVTECVPDIRLIGPAASEFSYWVALDKHTPQGKKALREAAKSMGIGLRQASWVSFYFESALCSEAVESCWWSREVHWRLQRVGLSLDQARSIWYKMQPVVADILEDEAKCLQEHIGLGNAPQHQLELL